MKRRVAVYGFIGIVAGLMVLPVVTWLSLKPVPDLDRFMAPPVKAQLLDRHGRPLTVTYENHWNRHDLVVLHDVPPLLRQAFVVSEDKRFFHHGGIDWPARLHAAWQNLRAMDAVRGASTLSEQVVRMLHPRPRTLWSRWLEGFEARRLEAANNKADILEFYLNQVPYAARRRGVAQAADYYFNRDLSTLTEKELLALVVMVRAPARFDVREDTGAVETRIRDLAGRLRKNNSMDRHTYTRLTRQDLHPKAGAGPVVAPHYARYVYSIESGDRPIVPTTLDATVQRYSQRILDQRLDALTDRHVDNAALLVADHKTNEILAWVVAGSGAENATAYDAARSPRQPGSALKPFVYARALSEGWTAATLIDDSPMSESVGRGLHTYHNYSRRHYGEVSLREALGNSLNIPAVKAMQIVGPRVLLKTFNELGIESLDRHPDYYGDGLALGNGEVTLLELVGAYAVLARGGMFEPLRTIDESRTERNRRRVFDETVATLIGDILSDPGARRLEFGDGGLLDLPVQTAVKTGTSSDYRDAWAMGYNHRYTVGVWMGNLSGHSMKEVTGSTGPALVLRAVFAELNRGQPARPLPLSPRLARHAVCIDTGRPAEGGCPRRDEWFAPGQWPPRDSRQASGPVRISRPHHGLQMAMDPRIPDEFEAFEFQLSPRDDIRRVEWYLDGARLSGSNSPRYSWLLERGLHVLQARVTLDDSAEVVQTRNVEFLVK